MPALIDLNADLGEERGDDLALLGLVTSANVAAGAHAGGGAVLRATVSAALDRGVAIGAHVSYPDRPGFGRRRVVLGRAALVATVRAQIDEVAAVAGVALRYVKAHGALYNVTADDRAEAEAFAEAVAACAPSLMVLTLPGCAAAEAARAAGLPVVGEGYADRGYRPDGRLVPRNEPGAVLHDPQEVAGQAVALARAGRVRSLCVHGDTPGAVALAAAVRAGVVAAGFGLRSFATGGP